MNAIEISALAAQMLGDQTFPNWQHSKVSRFAERVWPIAVATALRAHPWRFLDSIAVLPPKPEPARPTDTDPLALALAIVKWQAEMERHLAIYPYCYVLPTDLIRLQSVMVDGRSAPFGWVDGKYIRVRYGTPTIEYSANRSDPETWPEWFVDLMIANMASRMAYFITNSQSTADEAKKDFRVLLRDAKGVHGSEQESPILEVDSPTLDARGY